MAFQGGLTTLKALAEHTQVPVTVPLQSFSLIRLVHQSSKFSVVRHCPAHCPRVLVTTREGGKKKI